MIRDGTYRFVNQLDIQIKCGIPMAIEHQIIWNPTMDINQFYFTYAYVNHGRWIADCPFCNHSEFVFKNDLFFTCFHCFNQVAGGKRIKVILDPRYQEIENILNKRRNKENQNWFIYEEIEKLEIENSIMGVI